MDCSCCVNVFFQGFFRFENDEDKLKGRKLWEIYIKKNYRKFLQKTRDDAVKKYGSLTAARDHPPYFMPPSVWAAMLEKWDTAEFREICARNAANRSHRALSHNAGPTPFELRRELQV